MGLGPLDLPGPQFLGLYAVLLVLAVVLGIAIPRMLRPAGTPAPVTDEDELAYLAGGETRLTESVTARLLASGAIAMEGARRFAILRHDNAKSPGEVAVLSLHSPASWGQIANAVRPHAQTIAERLARRGLLLTQAEQARIRLLQTAPYLLLLAFGGTKLAIGISRDKPVAILAALLVITAIGAIIRYANLNRRTGAAIGAVKSVQSGSDRLRRAPDESESGMAVALFGTGVLAGSAFSELHDLRSSNSGSSDSGGDSGCSSDSSSGCSSDSDGGGCGGCGGGD